MDIKLLKHEDRSRLLSQVSLFFILCLSLADFLIPCDSFTANLPHKTSLFSLIGTGTPGLARQAEKDSLNDSKTVSSADLLEELEERFDYEGRLSSLPSSSQSHRCGYISLIGAANMGKSTLLNALLQENLCTTTHRPQTTRHSILGVLSSEEQSCQLCFTDTPGVIEDPAYKLQEGMMEAVKGAFHDSDVILIVTDLFSTPIPNDLLFEKISLSKKKKIVVVNKIDLANKVNVKASEQQQYHNSKNTDSEEIDESEHLYKRTMTLSEAVKNWRELVPDALAVIPVTASNGNDDVGVTALRTLLLAGPDVPKAFRDLGRPIPGMFQPHVQFISNEDALELLPLGPPLYDSEILTDKNERFFTSEIIRATLFCNLGKELPYCCEVRIEDFKEPKIEDKQKITRIRATICVERDSQKGIVVGKGGAKIKEVGIEARKQLEEFLQEKVHLELNVKVEKNWRKDESKLKAFGYLKK